MKKVAISWFIVIIAEVLMIATFCSCQSVQKATDYLKKKDALPKVCADNFPVKDSLIKGDSVIRYDTIWNEFSTGAVVDTVWVANTLLPSNEPVKSIKQVNKTIVVHDTLIRENTARVAALNVEVSGLYKQLQKKDDQLQGLKDKLDDMKKKRNWWRTACLLTWAAIGLYILARIKRFIPF